MRARPAVLTLTFTILALLIGLPIPDATYSADATYSGAKFAGVEDDVVVVYHHQAQAVLRAIYEP